MKNQRRYAAFFALLSVFLTTPALDAQVASSARVTGTVITSGARAVPGSLVSIRSLSGSASYEASTTSSGSFVVPILQPGEYEIRVEALGYRPLVVRGLVLSAGEERDLTLTIAIDPPPVERVDTLIVSSSTSSRTRAGGLTLGALEMRELPHRYDDLGALAASETAFDADLGSEGLPGEFTTVVADGVPFYRATHPTQRAERLPSPLFRRTLLDAVTIQPRATDTAVPGSVGGHVSVSTRRGGSGAPNVGGSWSGDPLWSSSEQTFDAPTLLSWQGFGNATADVAPGAQLLVAVDALRHESPVPVRLPNASMELPSLTADQVAGLEGPAVQSVQRIGGLVRFDRELSSTDRFFMRGLVGVSKRAFSDVGPLSATNTPDESVDFSTAFGYEAQTSTTIALDLRGGVSGSYRDFSEGGLPFAALQSPYADIGGMTGLTGSSSRTDFVLLPGLRIDTDGPQVLVGATLRGASQSMERMERRFAFDDGASVGGSTGYGSEVVTPSSDFSTRELGAHVQLRGSLSPTLGYAVGARYDLEQIGGDSVMLNEDWQLASGLANNIHNSSFHQLGARATITWTPIPGGSTQVQLQTSVDHGDVSPRWVYALTGEAADANSTRALGGGVDWPDADLPTGAAVLPSVALFGPDARAPRTFGTDLVLVQGFGSATILTLRGSSRRTDFLMRQRNLNLPVVPAGEDAGGRAIWGTLTQSGSMVTALGADGRRFASFGTATALDPDGWSEYRGATAMLEYTGPDVSLFSSYTWSETTDNWLGASASAAEAALPPGVPTAESDPSWAEGLSDFDVTHRVSVGGSVRAGPATASALFRYESGMPFTPGYRFGVDANGDGSVTNDVALLTDPGTAAALSAAGCTTSSGSFAERNSCRAPANRTLNVRLAFDLVSLGLNRAQLSVEVLNALESSTGIVDRALLLVDPAGTITTDTDGTITIPTVVNPAFGSVVYPTSLGRIVRIGFRVGS